MEMLLGLSEALPSLVEAKFRSATASSSLLFSQTELATIRTSTGVPFQLRFCPALAKKPVPKNDAAPKKSVDPFDNPPSALHIVDIPTTAPSHLLVLNKFPIIAEHFILATKSDKKQTHVLEQDDLELTYACLKAWQDGSSSKQRRLFAFFNSGEHSGASQPHRHLQFLPVESMRAGEVNCDWSPLTDVILSSNHMTTETSASLVQHVGLPFSHFAWPFKSEPSGQELIKAYNELYKAANEAVTKFIATSPELLALHPTDEGDSPFSYNLAMTTSGMTILPRRAEGTMLHRNDGSDVGFVGLNGTTLGGTMLVKHEEEWDTLRKRPELLDGILAAIGIPNDCQTYKSRV